MSYQSIDMQMSVPRTPEASGLHSQHLHKPVSEQYKLADDAAKQTEAIRHKNTNIEEAAGLNVRDEPGSSTKQQEKKKKRERKRKPEQVERLSDHPYKGNHIDLSL